MSNSILTKKDVDGAYKRWFLASQICFNYETMQSAGVVYALSPCLEKICKDNPEDLKARLKTHFQFFNTQPWMGGVILGAALAIEESGGENANETAAVIKTSLMGPFAGLGDSIFYVLPMTILGAIAAYMAQGGSSIGIVICLAFSLLMFFLRYKMWNIGYTQGVKFVTSNQSTLNSITDAASVMGLVVVGALVASNVKATMPLEITIGKSVSKVQTVILDSIMPNLLPLLVTLGTYWMLGKKKMTSSKMVWILIAVAIVAAYFKILG